MRIVPNATPAGGRGRDVRHLDRHRGRHPAGHALESRHRLADHVPDLDRPRGCWCSSRSPPSSRRCRRTTRSRSGRSSGCRSHERASCALCWSPSCSSCSATSAPTRSSGRSWRPVDLRRPSHAVAWWSSGSAARSGTSPAASTVSRNLGAGFVVGGTGIVVSLLLLLTIGDRPVGTMIALALWGTLLRRRPAEPAQHDARRPRPTPSKPRCRSTPGLQHLASRSARSSVDCSPTTRGRAASSGSGSFWSRRRCSSWVACGPTGRAPPEQDHRSGRPYRSVGRPARMTIPSMKDQIIPMRKNDVMSCATATPECPL